MIDPERADRVQVASEPGSPDRPNEDRAAVAGDTIVVVDGSTARTGSGCVHGVAWFADQLARGVLTFRHLGPAGALRSGIEHTASLHSGTCDLAHPATPCAAVGIVQLAGGFVHSLVLGDVTVVAGGGGAERVTSDQRVDATAPAQRAEVFGLPVGSAARSAALVAMKRGEIAARNRLGGYWVAGVDPAAVDHAIIDRVASAEVSRIAVLSDGAARAVDAFHLYDWPGALDLLADGGPGRLIAEVRKAERSDPAAARWPRNKISDDATVVFVTKADAGCG